MSATKRQTVRAAWRGFTLIEAIVIIVILGVLAALIAPRLMSRIGQSRVAVAKADTSTLANAMRMYMTDVGIPGSGDTIEVLWACPASVDRAAWRGPYVENADALIDPWGNMYVLRVPGEVNVDFDIVSLGADGQPGGEGDDADIVSGKK